MNPSYIIAIWRAIFSEALYIDVLFTSSWWGYPRFPVSYVSLAVRNRTFKFLVLQDRHIICINQSIEFKNHTDRELVYFLLNNKYEPN